MSLQEKTKRLKLTPLPTPKRVVQVLMSLDNETLPDDIKQLIKEKNEVNALYPSFLGSFFGSGQSIPLKDDIEGEE